MKKQDYESLTRVNKFKRLVKVALITLVVAAAVLAPTLWYWEASIEMRGALRSAKNVLMNTELLAVRFDGLEETFLDSSRPSGLSKEAEEQIRNYSGAKGAIKLTAWDRSEGAVLAMTYQEGRFLLTYEKEEKAESGEWSIYRKVRVYEN